MWKKVGIDTIGSQLWLAKRTPAQNSSTKGGGCSSQRGMIGQLRSSCRCMGKAIHPNLKPKDKDKSCLARISVLTRNRILFCLAATRCIMSYLNRCVKGTYAALCARPAALHAITDWHEVLRQILGFHLPSKVRKSLTAGICVIVLISIWWQFPLLDLTREHGQWLSLYKTAALQRAALRSNLQANELMSR